MVVFESLAKLLLFAHLIAAACATGAAIHLAIRVWHYLRGRLSFKALHENLYAGLLLIFYAIAYVLGASIYPTFRVRVRGEYFDTDLPAATGLFEVKEHLATTGMVIVIAIWLLARVMDPPARPEARRLLPLYAGLVTFVLLIIVYNVWSGWYLTTLKAV